MLIGVPKETAAGEKRVATVPDVVAKLVKLGFSVAVQSGANEVQSLSFGHLNHLVCTLAQTLSHSFCSRLFVRSSLLCLRRLSWTRGRQ